MPAASSSTTSSIGRSIGSSARNGPSRRAGIRTSHAATLGAGLLIVGVAAAAAANTTALVVALAIAACVLLYDAWGKRHAAVAPLNMAMCRALNLLLGVAAVPAALASAWPIAAVPLLYIYAVTTISRGEVHGGSRRAAGSALRMMLVSLAGLVLVVIRAGYNAIPALILVAALAWRVVPAFVAARRQPQPRRSAPPSSAACCRWSCSTPPWPRRSRARSMRRPSWQPAWWPAGWRGCLR